MATHATIRTVPAIVPVPKVQGTSLAGRLFAFLARIAAEIRLHHDMRRLQEFDGRMLHDIGLSSGSIEDAVRHGRSRLDSPLPPAVRHDLLPPPSAFVEWR